MHPLLTVKEHPHCADAILALKRCHEENPWQKFVGVCNEAKRKLDSCLREEKGIKSALNRERAKKDREALLAKIRERDVERAEQAARMEKGGKDENRSERTDKRCKLLLGITGSVAAIKLEEMVQALEPHFELQVVVTEAARNFFENHQTSSMHGIHILGDKDEWNQWQRKGDPVMHIDLRNWADILLIAPLSANTLAKFACGLADNLLTCIFRAWDFQKPVLVAPAMNTLMWDSIFTERHLRTLKELGVIVIPPICKTLACGDVGMGAMAPVEEIAKLLKEGRFIGQ